MKKSATDSSHGSTQHLGKGTYSLVLSLADQKLTLEKNDNLGQFDDGKLSIHLSLRTENRLSCRAGHGEQDPAQAVETVDTPRGDRRSSASRGTILLSSRHSIR